MNISTRFAFYLLILLLVTVIGIVKFRKLSEPFTHISVLTGITFLSEFSSRYFAYAIKNSSPSYHFYVPLQLIFLSFAYYHFLDHAKTKKIILIVVLALLVINLMNSLFFQGLHIFPSNAIIINSCWFLLLSLLGFRQMLQFPLGKSLSRQSIFWLNCSVLIFFATTFFIYSFYNYFIENKFSTKVISTVNYAITLGFYLVIGTAIMIDNKKDEIQ